MVHVKLYGIVYKTTNPTVEKCIVLETMANYVAIFGSGDAAMVLPSAMANFAFTVKCQVSRVK
jgi:hypothetical protein